MANALEQANRRHAAEVRPADKPRHATPTTSELERLLAGIDQGKANELMAAWDRASRESGATMGEAMWSLAMLQARILASGEMGDEQVWVAARFAELVAAALPAMMLAVEQAKRKAEGKPEHDG